MLVILMCLIAEALGGCCGFSSPHFFPWKPPPRNELLLCPVGRSVTALLLPLSDLATGFEFNCGASDVQY